MTAEQFRNRILEVFYQDVHRVEKDNYAWERFSADGVDRSALFDVAKHVSYMAWFTEKFERLYQVFIELADDASRDLFVDLIRFKLSGHIHVRIRSQVPLRHQQAATFREQFVGEPSTVVTAGMFGGLVHYDREWKGVQYVVDTIKNALIYPLVYRQYFFERGAVRIQPELGDHVIDGGAFTGDSACIFSKIVGETGRVYTFDPVQNHLDIVRANVERPGYENVQIFAYGLSDRRLEAPPIRLESYHPGFRVNDTVPLCRIDDLVIDAKIDKVDFIKMDIEGSELAALRGCLATLHRFKPKLAISIYHRPDDFFEIQEFLAAQKLGYKFFVDHYTIWDEETVLYASVA